MYREEDINLKEVLRGINDRIRALEQGTVVRTRSWTIEENTDGDIIFTHSNGKIVIIPANGLDPIILG